MQSFIETSFYAPRSEFIHCGQDVLFEEELFEKSPDTFPLDCSQVLRVGVHEGVPVFAGTQGFTNSHQFAVLAADLQVAFLERRIGGVDVVDNPAIAKRHDRCVEEYMLNEPTLRQFIDLQNVVEEGGHPPAEVLERVRSRSGMQPSVVLTGLTGSLTMATP